MCASVHLPKLVPQEQDRMRLNLVPLQEEQQ